MKFFGRVAAVFLAALLLISPYTGNTVAADVGVCEDRVTRFLLLGADRATGLTDSIMLISINETRREVQVLQIPRDTYAAYTEGSYKKLNGASHRLGERGAKAFLSNALGVPIDYFVVLKLDFFEELVDAVGGVDLVIDRDMEYSDPAQGLHISLKAGQTHLDGRMAEQFVRYRIGYANADLGRLDAQKQFLSAFAKKCKSLSLAQLTAILPLALTGVQTDLGLAAAIRILGVLKECDPTHIPMATLAGQAVRGKSGAWYYVLNREGAYRMVREYAMLPTLEDAQFDPQRLFDRTVHPQFHQVYTASEAELPILSFN